MPYCFEAGMLFPEVTRSDNISDSGWYIFTRRAAPKASERVPALKFLPAAGHSAFAAGKSMKNPAIL